MLPPGLAIPVVEGASSGRIARTHECERLETATEPTVVDAAKRTTAI